MNKKQRRLLEKISSKFAELGFCDERFSDSVVVQVCDNDKNFQISDGYVGNVYRLGRLLEVWRSVRIFDKGVVTQENFWHSLPEPNDEF